MCTLCRCKFRKKKGKPKNVVDLAQVGDWVVGTGGKNRQRSAGHGKIVYAMRVDKKISREEYHRRYRRQRSDAKDKPKNEFERMEQFALLSYLPNFFYFGRQAIDIPREHVIAHLEKRGPGFRRDFEEPEIRRFVSWLKRNRTPGRTGDPCMKDDACPPHKGVEKCKSSC
jgi:hypothetical protein